MDFSVRQQSFSYRFSSSKEMPAPGLRANGLFTFGRREKAFHENALLFSVNLSVDGKKPPAKAS
jgi:hypothetical protein